MNSQLIPTISGQIDGQTQPLVDARQLHEFLRVGRDFTTWIKGRISKYGFAENVDFSRSPVLGSGKNQGLSFGGENRTDYFLTLDMAKELCMVEKSEIGRQARRYFIEMERVAKQGVNREYVALLESQNQALKTELARVAPQFVRIAFYHNVGLDMAEMRTLTKRSARTVRRNLARLAACGLTDYQPDPYLSACGRLGNLRRRQNAEFLAAQQSLSLEG
ncbi:antA/AntB antirepressor family protein [Neisseria weixii]|uniref:antA/AntB antirepressor family protein n=1 Tax=Neisseria weixii TaxID=1853276 RepID=UPI003613E63A